MLRRSFALGSVLLAGLSVGLVGGPLLKAELADHKPQQTGIAKELGSYHPVVNVVLPAVVRCRKLLTYRTSPMPDSRIMS